MGTDQPYVAPAQPDPFAVAMAQKAQQDDIAGIKSDLASRNLSLGSMFGLGSGVMTNARGASFAGGLNGLPSIAMTPLGAGR